MMSFLHRIILPVFLIVLLHGALAMAQNVEDEARAKFSEGLDAFEKGEFLAAATAFREANQMRFNWKLLYNIGQSEGAAGRFGLSLEAFESYLAQGADSNA